MLTLTPEAARAVFDVVVAQEPAAGAGLRISPGPRSAFEETWDYLVVKEPQDGDLVVADGLARVFVSPEAAARLEDAVLDAHVDEDTGEVRFVVSRR